MDDSAPHTSLTVPGPNVAFSVFSQARSCGVLMVFSGFAPRWARMWLRSLPRIVALVMGSG